jgi:hypothetical protein
MGRTTTLVAASDVEVLGWPGLKYRVDTWAKVPAEVGAGAGVGTLQLTGTGPAGSTAVKTSDAIDRPDWWERLTHR